MWHSKFPVQVRISTLNLYKLIEIVTHKITKNRVLLYKLFINNNGKKGILDSLIMDYLTERGLAYWFMDDGGKLDYNKNSKNRSIVLNTQSFTDQEVEKMSKELMAKFNFECELRTNKSKKVIVISNNSYPLFYELVSPHIIPEMKYKLPQL